MKYILLLEELSNAEVINDFISNRIDIHDIFDMYNDFKDEFIPISTYSVVSFVISHQTKNYWHNTTNQKGLEHLRNESKVDIILKLDSNFKVISYKKDELERSVRLLRSKNSEFSIEINFRFDISNLLDRSYDVRKYHSIFKQIENKIDEVNKRISSIYNCSVSKTKYNEDILFRRFNDEEYFNVDLKIELLK